MRDIIKILVVIALAASGSLRAQTYELTCPAGFSPMPTVGTTFNQSTGFYRAWLCYDAFGNVTGSLSSSTPSSVGFNFITSGVNTSATMQVGSGATLSPLNNGQLASSQNWNIPALPAPTATMTNSGGTITSAQTLRIQYTLNVGSTESLPSNIVQVNNAALGCNTAVCTITIGPPTIPSGYTGFTAYFCDVSVGPCTLPIKVTACINIAIGCLITTTSPAATTQAPTVATAYLVPPGAQSLLGVLGGQVIDWNKKSDGNYYPYATINSTDDGAGTGIIGTRTIVDRTYFSDAFAGQSPRIAQNSTAVSWSQQQPFKNSFISINHWAGNTTAINNQDRAIGMSYANAFNDTATHWGFEGIQQEMDINGAPTISGGVDSEIANISLQLVNAVTSNVTQPVGGIHMIRASYSDGDSAAPAPALLGTTIDGYQISFTQNSTVANKSALNYFGFHHNFSSNNGASQNNMIQVAFNADYGNYTRFGAINASLWSHGSGFTPTAFSDWQILNDTHNFDSYLNGGVFLNTITASDQAAVPVRAALDVIGSIKVDAMATANGPASVTCTGGASTYTYKFVYKDQNGGAKTSNANSSGATCLNPLTSGNPATVAISGIFTGGGKFEQVESLNIEVWRTGGPMATGKIGTATCTVGMGRTGGCQSFSDTGLAASGSATEPSVDTTGSAAFAGYVAHNLNTVRVASDFTSAANTSLQTITGLTWNLDTNAKNYSFHCSLFYSQATAAASMQFGIQAATVAPTNINAKGRVDTSTSAQTSGVLTGLTTTTATSIVTFTPSATATVFGADLDGSIEEPQNNQGQIINVMVQTSNSADLPTVKRGSYCYLY